MSTRSTSSGLTLDKAEGSIHSTSSGLILNKTEGSTLIVNLNKRIKESTRFESTSVAEYFRKSPLRWWKPTQPCYREQETTIASWLEEIQPFSVLELGPGKGRISRLIHENLVQQKSRGRFTMIEINEKCCGLLKRKFGHFPFVDIVSQDFTIHDFERSSIGLATIQYELIVALEVLVHIPNIPALIHRINSALRPHGSIFFSITPVDFYKRNDWKRTVIHRGIDEHEFEDLTFKVFHPKAIHHSKNGQILTYWLTKKDGL